MKVRSLLLFACMIVVPFLAMFSHKLPAEMRAAWAAAVLDPAIELIDSLAGSAVANDAAEPLDFNEPPVGPLLGGEPQPLQVPARSDGGQRLGGTDPGSSLGGLPAAVRPPPASEPSLPLPAAAGGAPAPPQRFRDASPGAQNTAAAFPSQSPSGEPAALSRQLRRRLEVAGVERLLLEPVADGSGGVRGSCRLAVDAEGQLQRLFQTCGATEVETLRRLNDQVGRWRSRFARRDQVPVAPGRSAGNPAP